MVHRHETEDKKRRFGAKVVSIYEVPDKGADGTAEDETTYIVQIAYPMDNFGANIPMLLSTAFGNIASSGKVKWLDCALPERYVNQFQGPAFGVSGLRKLLGVYDRPLLNAMIKPNIGWTPKEGAQLFYEAARGGVDVIKDDELLSADMPFCPMAERVPLFMRLTLEVLAAVREAVGPQFPIEFRMSGSELFEGGYDLNEGVKIACAVEPYVDMGPIAVAAYSYMALVPIIQPPIMKLCTTEEERKIKMDQLRPISKKERILFPIIVTIVVCSILPSTTPLVGMNTNICRRLSDGWTVLHRSSTGILLTKRWICWQEWWNRNICMRFLCHVGNAGVYSEPCVW